MDVFSTVILCVAGVALLVLWPWTHRAHGLRCLSDPGGDPYAARRAKPKPSPPPSAPCGCESPAKPATDRQPKTENPTPATEHGEQPDPPQTLSLSEHGRRMAADVVRILAAGRPVVMIRPKCGCAYCRQARSVAYLCSIAWHRGDPERTRRAVVELLDAGEAFECRIAALANVGLRRLTQRHEAAKG